MVADELLPVRRDLVAHRYELEKLISSHDTTIEDLMKLLQKTGFCRGVTIG